MAKKYKLNNENEMVRDNETMQDFHSEAKKNNEAEAYRVWITKGNTPDPWKTKAELNTEKYAQFIVDDIEVDETEAMKVKRAASITKLKGEGKLPQNYKDPLYQEE